MASALSPDINSQEVNLGVATKLMTETYLQALSEMSRSELRNFDKHTIQAQLEAHMWELMGNNVQRTALELKCERMCDTLYSEVHRLLQYQSSETRSARGRLSALFQTPLNSIKRGLSTATRGHSLLESKSASLESLSELLGSSRVHDTTNRVD